MQVVPRCRRIPLGRAGLSTTGPRAGRRPSVRREYPRTRPSTSNHPCPRHPCAARTRVTNVSELGRPRCTGALPDPTVQRRHRTTGPFQPDLGATDALPARNYASCPEGPSEPAEQGRLRDRACRIVQFPAQSLRFGARSPERGKRCRRLRRLSGAAHPSAGPMRRRQPENAPKRLQHNSFAAS
jgi:hypothetical protein